MPVDPRDYLIHSPDGGTYPAYVAVFSAGLLGQYYDVQGMTWTGAPMFQDPDQTVTLAGRTYSLYYSGQHLMVVAWYEHGAVYWVHNSLTDAVENRELLAIAGRTEPIGTPGTPGSQIGGPGASGNPSLKAVVVPPRGPAGTSVIGTIVSSGGLMLLIAAPLLSLAVLCPGPLRRRLERYEPRRQPHTNQRRRLPSVPARPDGTLAPPAAAGPAAYAYTTYRSSRMSGLTPPRIGLRRPRVTRAGVASLAAASVLAVSWLERSVTRPRPRHHVPSRLRSRRSRSQCSTPPQLKVPPATSRNSSARGE